MVVRALRVGGVVVAGADGLVGALSGFAFGGVGVDELAEVDPGWDGGGGRGLAGHLGDVDGLGGEGEVDPELLREAHDVQVEDVADTELFVPVVGVDEAGDRVEPVAVLKQ